VSPASPAKHPTGCPSCQNPPYFLAWGRLRIRWPTHFEARLTGIL